VDTLNEALKIAAMDIAEVAEAEDDYFLSDEEEDGEEEDDDTAEMRSLPSTMAGAVDDGKSETVSMATASATSNPSGAEKRKGSNQRSKRAATERKEELYREVLRDGGATAGGGTATASSTTARSTFVIQEDGTFQRKK
jgi:hypothetical protein